MKSWTLAALLIASGTFHAQAFTPAQRGQIDQAVKRVMEETQVPSVSVGISRGQKIVYAQAFGEAVLPRNVAVASTVNSRLALSQETTKAVPATAEMAYPIGSISKQFTAACVLLLQERGALRLDDPVSKWFPQLTRANDITLRNLLTHTSGYSDYAPQDYTIPLWTRTGDPQALVNLWASKPLDFDPGTKWQYSNTNFVLAALIVEKASGQRFHDFLWQNVIVPLKLQGVLDLDTDRAQLRVRGYERHALGPLRPAILEAPGWYYGDAELAMPVATLLAWDESIVHRTLLKPASYDALETEFRLKNGTGSGYGLGVKVQRLSSGKRVITHSGEVGGFVSNNVVALDDDICFAALTNEEAHAAKLVTAAITPMLLGVSSTTGHASATKPLPSASAATVQAEAQAQTILTSLQEEDLDPALFTGNANFYFNPETLADYSSSLAPLGEVRSVQQTSEELRGGMTFRNFNVQFAKGHPLTLSTYTTPSGILEQFIVGP